jgi:hypothetical protein
MMGQETRNKLTDYWKDHEIKEPRMNANEHLSLISEDVPSPAWHADVLRAREQRISDGRSRFLDIAEAKAAVREKIQ